MESQINIANRRLLVGYKEASRYAGLSYSRLIRLVENHQIRVIKDRLRGVFNGLWHFHAPGLALNHGILAPVGWWRPAAHFHRNPPGRPSFGRLGRIRQPSRQQLIGISGGG
jgi:hypothetical protein